MSPFSGLSHSENGHSTLFQNIGLQKPKHVADDKLLIKLCLDMFLHSFIKRECMFLYYTYTK